MPQIIPQPVPELPGKILTVVLLTPCSCQATRGKTQDGRTLV